MKKIKKCPNRSLNIFLLISSCILAFILAEIILRIFLPSPKYLFPPYYMTADNLAGYDITPNFAPSTFSFIDSRFKVWSNELGCFDRAYDGEKDYILLVGDSFAWGNSPFQNLNGMLIERYLGYRLLKCGVPAYGTKQEFLKIQKVVKKIKNYPRLIILAYFLGNDIEEDYYFPTSTVIDGYLLRKTSPKDEATGEKLIKPDEVLRRQLAHYKKYGTALETTSRWVRIKFWLSMHSQIYNAIRQNSLMRKAAAKFYLLNSFQERPYRLPFIPIQKYAWLKNAWLKHLENLKSIKELASSYGSGLLVVLIPTKEQVYGFLQKEPGYLWQQPNNILHNFCVQQGINYLDLTPDFKAHANQAPRPRLDAKRDLYFSIDLHWNTRGNKLAALLITEYILRHNLIDVADKAQKIEHNQQELERF